MTSSLRRQRIFSVLVGISTFLPLISSASLSGPAPFSVSLGGGVSGGSSPYTYSWTFGDGTGGSGQNVSHTYTTAGTYTATLSITDNLSHTVSTQQTITVSSPVTPPPTPTPPPPPPPSGTSGLTAALNAALGYTLTSSNPLTTACSQFTGPCTAGTATLSAAGDNNTDDTNAFQTAINIGDVNAPGNKTYYIHGTINIPSHRMLQCQPGAILRGDGAQIISFSNTNFSSLIGCTIQTPNKGLVVSGGGQNRIIGNTIAQASQAMIFTGGTVSNVVTLNDLQTSSGLTTDTTTNVLSAINIQR